MSTEVSKNSKKKQQLYRLVSYHYQWPVGDVREVVADNLTKEQAEKLKQKSSEDKATEDYVIEPINH